MEKENKIKIKTSAGTLVAEGNNGTAAPSIALYFIPKGKIEEIDLCLAEVKEEPELWNDGETEEDVALYVYGNVARDEWTDRFDYKREDVLNALEEYEN